MFKNHARAHVHDKRIRVHAYVKLSMHKIFDNYIIPSFVNIKWVKLTRKVFYRLIS